MKTIEHWEDLGQCIMGYVDGMLVVTDTLIYLDRETKLAVTKDDEQYTLGTEKL